MLLSLQSCHSAGRAVVRSADASAPQARTGDDGLLVTWSSGEGRRYAHRTTIPRGGELAVGVQHRNGWIEPHSHRPLGSICCLSAAYWSISNFTAYATFAVENLEGGAELIKVVPRRLRVVVPFEMARVLILLDCGLVELNVFGQPPSFLDNQPGGSESDAPPLNLDPRSKYFRVLVALCEPRLRGCTMAAVPSVQEVVERLRGCPDFTDATRSSINYHIDYLQMHKLPIPETATSFQGGRMHSKREALVYFALRHDLVREEHLALLPPIQWP